MKVAATPSPWSSQPAILYLSVAAWKANEPRATHGQREAAVAPGRSKRTAGSSWDSVAACESGGNWSINTGNGYYGGLQMNMDFWRSYGGLEFAPRPDLATREQQITVAERAAATRGRSPWPVCGSR